MRYNNTVEMSDISKDDKIYDHWVNWSMLINVDKWVLPLPIGESIRRLTKEAP